VKNDEGKGGWKYDISESQYQPYLGGEPVINNNTHEHHQHVGQLHGPYTMQAMNPPIL
jgi:hypothetical protein